ncbi:hypothetical protein [Haloterrigena salifodinae]|uniref:hypothetical protein n=1 Tax=Haloterrigena salifodinae TaxID=2675099 RepID=UPI000F893239|nr:hypothetical protein [Haloterrigena salifodinae]
METEKDDHLNRLYVTETFPETDPVRLRNETNDDLSFDIRVTYADIVPLHNKRVTDIVETRGNVLVEETVKVGTSQSTTLRSNKNYRYGSYQAEVKVDELDLSNVITWVMYEEWDSGGVIELSPDRELNHRSRRLSEYGTAKGCEWNDDGELIEGPV